MCQPCNNMQYKKAIIAADHWSALVFYLCTFTIMRYLPVFSYGIQINKLNMFYMRLQALLIRQDDLLLPLNSEELSPQYIS